MTGRIWHHGHRKVLYDRGFQKVEEEMREEVRWWCMSNQQSRVNGGDIREGAIWVARGEKKMVDNGVWIGRMRRGSKSQELKPPMVVDFEMDRRKAVWTNSEWWFRKPSCSEPQVPGVESREKEFCPGELEKTGINLGNRPDRKGPHGQRGDVEKNSKWGRDLSENLVWRKCFWSLSLYPFSGFIFDLPSEYAYLIKKATKKSLTAVITFLGSQMDKAHGSVGR